MAMIIAKPPTNSNALNLDVGLFMERMGPMYFKESALNAKVASEASVSSHNLLLIDLI
ncbi:hypothetical protein [Vibrio tapetis]|nr:hypothetical protein [Vibrio tapetis]